ncbi:NADH-quinone oxidoreductase subunit L, partial [bacterium]|nr:NADH-quinone oxidoreductase subunit L [bacterium]
IAPFDYGFGTISVCTAITFLLFIGAMGKSAQIPLHVWLPDSMEGPTPISALIHAATMVTAGIFMVARLSPLFEQAPATLSMIVIIGALTSFLMGLLGIIQQDIKRVVAYSTLSQLGYMITALGVSAYAAGVFHVMTHAFFKALLFLGAGSVIIALHHVQDIRQMGGLWRHLPVTCACMWVGTLALVGFPGFSGFYSKDYIIESVAHAPGDIAHIAHILLVAGVFITALYSFRLMFLVFHGKPRAAHHAHETPWVMRLPLILLAVPAAIVGYVTWPWLGNFFGYSLMQPHAWPTTHPLHLAMEGFQHGLFGLTVAGFVVAWLFYLQFPHWPQVIVTQCRTLLRPFYAHYG